ncbi:hypothetical protein, partial [Fervidobacterium gondwanense]
MKYSEIIGLYDSFHPVYDLENEYDKEYWKIFVPNKKFYEILSNVITSFDGLEKERKSIWIQGAYGTGKSHATAVIKHLLWDDPRDIRDFVERIEDSQFQERIKHFRNDSKVLPVVIKGTSGIDGPRTLRYVVQRAVKKSLLQVGDDVEIESEFEQVINQIEKGIVRLEKLIQEADLAIYGDGQEIMKKLRNGDTEILRKIERVLENEGLHVTYDNITDWLSKVVEKLREKRVADYLAIYWDEFTGVLELQNAGSILTEIQSIAELSEHEGVYLFIISHRKIEQFSKLRDDIGKVRDRFKVIEYSMEPITAYHIVKGALKKLRPHDYEMVRKETLSRDVKDVMESIAVQEQKTTNASELLETLQDGFPIHPYTIYTAVLVARYFGSTERSIFKFLHDEVHGFKGFIEKNPDEEGEYFLTADKLWDFFYSDFEIREDDATFVITERYKRFKNQVEQNGEEYIKVFKGILLLNLLSRYIDISEAHENLYAPHRKNIKMMFAGSIKPSYIDTILAFFEENEIFVRTQDENYFVTNSSLKHEEINKERKQLEPYYNNVSKIVEEVINNLDSAKEELEKLVQIGTREYKYVLLDDSMNENTIRSRLLSKLKPSSALNFALIFGTNEYALSSVKNLVRNLSLEKNFSHIIFLVLDTLFEEQVKNEFIKNKAMAKVAESHRFNDEALLYQNNAIKTIKDWLSEVTRGYVNWYLNGASDRVPCDSLGDKVGIQLTNKVFPHGFETLEELRKNDNVWTRRNSAKAAEPFILAKNRDELVRQLEDKKGIYRFLVDIIKDNSGEYIVSNNLEIRPDVDKSHPLVVLSEEVEKAIEFESKKGIFNLGEALEFLSEPPYGLYPCAVYFAALAFSLRKYVGKLYDLGKNGKEGQINEMQMIEKIGLIFDYFSDRKRIDKLEVRKGTEQEKKLSKILADIFGITSEITSSLVGGTFN